MAIGKNDFIEIEFTAKIKTTGEVFDTNKKEDAKALGLKEVKPFVIVIGQNMAIPGLDKSLENKEIGKEYTEEFAPVDAFGVRHKNLVRMIPMKVFIAQKIYPQAGMQLSLDGMLARVISVSGGRVLMDFNNPLSGKNVVYNFKVVRKIEDTNEKINALQDYFFKQRFDFVVKEKEITIKVPEQMLQLIPMFNEPFNKILGMTLKAEKAEEKKN